MTRGAATGGRWLVVYTITPWSNTYTLVVEVASEDPSVRNRVYICCSAESDEAQRVRRINEAVRSRRMSLCVEGNKEKKAEGDGEESVRNTQTESKWRR